MISPAEARVDLEDVRSFLVHTLVPHEIAEDRTTYPILAAAIGSDDATSALHGTHTEIFHLVRLFDRLLDELGSEGPTSDDRTDLRRTLYGLDAILRLHMAQEEELYQSISSGAPPNVLPRPV